MLLLNGTPAPVDWALKFAEWGIQGLVTIISVLGAAYLAYKYAIKQIRKETNLLIEREKYNRTLNSLQDCWKLLVYMTDTENEKCLLVFEQVKGSTQKTWYLRRPQAEEFMQKLPEYFYSGGNGLFLPVPLREPLFKYRGILSGLLLNEKNRAQKKFIVENNHLVGEMIAIHHQLVKLLREEANLKTPRLPEKNL